jgi:putative protease
MKEQEVGKIIHYFSGIGVAILELSAPLKVGDKLHIKGANTDFTQGVDSMQIEHKGVQTAKKGDAIGLKVADHAREGDTAFRVVE